MPDGAAIEENASPGFSASVLQILEQHPAGLGEYELMQHLRSAGHLGFLSSAPISPPELFAAHFILFHVLYRMRDDLWAARQAHLDIHTLKIRLTPYCAGSYGVQVSDPMREYYLDTENLESTTDEEVYRLIDSFWNRMYRDDRRAAALADLGLSDPVDDESIRSAYRRLVQRHHPDRGGDKEKLQTINAAVELLLKQACRP